MESILYGHIKMLSLCTVSKLRVVPNIYDFAKYIHGYTSFGENFWRFLFFFFFTSKEAAVLKFLSV